MSQQFKNMQDLVAYLSTLEQRISKLQTENAGLRAEINQMSHDSESAIAKFNLRRTFPQTNLISPNFLKRAFTVWGHFFVANLIISVIVGLIYACLMMALFGSLFGNLIHNAK